MSGHPIYASTAGIARHYATLSEQLSAMTTAGLTHIELGWAAPQTGLIVPEGLREFSTHFLVHNYFPAPEKPFVLNLAAQEPMTLARSREFGLAAIRLCADLGAPFYSIHSGFLAEFDPASLGRELTYLEICDYERGYATFLDSLDVLLTEARQTGVRLLVEPNVVAPFNLIDGENQLLMLAEPREFLRLLREVNDHRLGVLLDLGHLKVTATTLGFGICEFIDAVAPAVGAFHLHDNDGTADQHQAVEATSWTLDVVRQRRFDGKPVVVEAKFENVEALAQHCVALKTLLNR